MSFDIRDKSVVATYITAGNYGYYSIGLDEYDTDAEPELQAGFVEVGGEIYENTAALAITGWSGIAVSTQTYIYIVPGGTAATCIFSSTAPTWSNTKQGWYNGNDRALWMVYKDAAGTGYTRKLELLDQEGWLKTSRFYAQGDYTDTAGTLISSVTLTNGNGTQTSGDFIILYPISVYGTFTAGSTSGDAITRIQAKINSSYSSISAGVSGTRLGLNTGAIAITDPAIYEYYTVLTPGIYRLNIEKINTYTGAINAELRVFGNFGGGNEL